MNNETLFSRIKFRPRDITRRIILHDSHTGPNVENIADYLRNKGREMGLMDVGYHAIFDRDGTMTQTRDWTVWGSHTPGHNYDSIGLCLVGGSHMDGWLEGGAFTFDQRKALFATLAFLMKTWPDLKVIAHTEVQKFRNRMCSCPDLDVEQLRDDFTMYRKYGIIP